MKISEYRLKRNSEHVFYEISMFLVVIKRLAYLERKLENAVLLNTYLESFAIHLRNLLDFFYISSSNRINSDDVLAEDFLLDIKSFKKNRTPLSNLSYTRKKVHKQIAHLTYHRNKYNSKTKTWNYGEIHSQLLPTIISFHKALSIRRKKWNYFIKLNGIIKDFSIL